MTLVNGIVVVDKPAGMTSHDVVAVARRLFQTKRIGHTGTLDPDATGVMVLCLGMATRLAEYLSAARKHYIAEVTFGIETDTQDASGKVLTETDASHLTEEAVRALLPRFQGRIQQVPPMMSALHHEGQRLYELARAGVVVERAAREVEIESLALTSWTPAAHPIARLEITCSTGTYIRTLAADLGAAAGAGALMRTLRRTWVGESEARAFTLQQAASIDVLRAHAEAHTLADVVLPPAAALADWPQVRLTPEETTRIRQGRALDTADLDAARRTNWPAPDLEMECRSVALLDETGELIAVARPDESRLQPVKVFAT